MAAASKCPESETIMASQVTAWPYLCMMIGFNLAATSPRVCPASPGIYLEIEDSFITCEGF